MSDLSKQSLALLGEGKVNQAIEWARKSVNNTPDDWHSHYALGQCLRFANDFPQACSAIARADELMPGQPPVLLALGIARQQEGNLNDAIKALQLALQADPDYVLAFNSLAMTQKLMGEYEKTAHNYDAGACALSRRIVASLINAADPHGESWNNLWAEYASFAMTHCCALEPSIDQVAWPTGEMAARDQETAVFGGWYWEDKVDQRGQKVRFFYPNFFNTFYRRLRETSEYANLIGNRSTVLELLGQVTEARKHLEEADDFSSRV